jgi:hypothetical protein
MPLGGGDFQTLGEIAAGALIFPFREHPQLIPAILTPLNSFRTSPAPAPSSERPVGAG